MAIAINIPINKNICVFNGKQILDRASKSVTPVKEDIVRIDNNKNKDPNIVYRNKYKLALVLLFEPKRPIRRNKGGSILSKNI